MFKFFHKSPIMNEISLDSTNSMDDVINLHNIFQIYMIICLNFPTQFAPINSNL